MGAAAAVAARADDAATTAAASATAGRRGRRERLTRTSTRRRRGWLRLRREERLRRSSTTAVSLGSEQLRAPRSLSAVSSYENWSNPICSPGCQCCWGKRPVLLRCCFRGTPVAAPVVALEAWRARLLIQPPLRSTVSCRVVAVAQLRDLSDAAAAGIIVAGGARLPPRFCVLHIATAASEMCCSCVLVLQWPAIFSEPVDMTKVNADVMKAWVYSKITSLLGFEDDIVISYCMTQLYPDEAMSADVDARRNYLCAKKLAISLTGFMGKSATQFVKELWELLVAAQKQKNGIPPAFLENKKLEMQRKREEAAKVNEELIRRHEQMMKEEFNRQVKDMATGQAEPKRPTVLAANASVDTGVLRGWDVSAGAVPRPITVQQNEEVEEEEHVRRRAPSSSRSGSEASDYGRRGRHERRFKEKKKRARSGSRSRSRSPPRNRSRSRDRDRERERKHHRSRSRDRR